MKKLLILLCMLALTGCSSGPVKRVYPPQASLQEVTAQADGHWLLKVRLQNFSTVAMTYSALDAKLTIAGQDAGHVQFATDITVGPDSTDVVSTVFAPTSPAKAAVAAALASRTSVRYALTGKITSRDPKGNYDTTYESALNPAPGLSGVLR